MISCANASQDNKVKRPRFNPARRTPSAVSAGDPRTAPRPRRARRRGGAAGRLCARGARGRGRSARAALRRGAGAGLPRECGGGGGRAIADRGGLGLEPGAHAACVPVAEARRRLLRHRRVKVCVRVNVDGCHDWAHRLPEIGCPSWRVLPP